MAFLTLALCGLAGGVLGGMGMGGGPKSDMDLLRQMEAQMRNKK